MNVTNTTPTSYVTTLGDTNLDEYELDYYESNQMVGVVPRHAYLCFIYIILTSGLIGNACVIALMQNRDFYNLSYPVYLRVLAVSDSFLLISVCTEDILHHNFDRLHDFLTSSVALCKIWTYIRHTASFISPWLVMALTFDRFVAVVFPLKRAFYCSRRSAIIASSILVASILLESSFHLILAEIDLEQYDCMMPEWKSLVNYSIFRNLVLETTLPCTTILILNVYIIIVINRSRKFRAAVGSTQSDGVKTSRVDKATVSLLAVSVMAFITLLPISILQIVEWAWEDEITRREDTLDETNLEQVQALDSLIEKREEAGEIWPALNLVFLLNFGQNFYVMLLTGPKYRSIVTSWFRCLCCRRRKQPRAGTMTFSTPTTNESQTQSRF